MNQDHDVLWNTVKVVLTWIGTVIGMITLQKVVLALTGVYTAVQLYIVLRDKIFTRK